jgi:hypothetical protein
MLQVLLGSLFAFLFVRLLMGVVRVLLGSPGRRAERVDAPETRRAVPAAARAPRIDRSTAIDVPFTEITAGAATERVVSDSREEASRVGRSG